jgi:hypothetical protein
MVKPVVLRKNGVPSIIWNIEANVGLNSPNRQDDVELVQLGYVAMLSNPKTSNTPEEREAYGRIRPGSPCTGRADDPLVTAIKVHQRVRGGSQDGHVSPFVETASGTYDGVHAFMIIPLLNNLSDVLPGIFPRLDRHASCPSTLRTRVAKACTL